MEIKNDFKIIERDNNLYPIEDTFGRVDVKRNPLRGNVVVKYALVGSLSLSQVAAATDFNTKNHEDIQKFSLEQTERITNEISKYSTKLNKLKCVDKFQLFEDILSFKTLENNWDGFSAKPAGIKCASNSIKIIDKLDRSLLEKISSYYPNPNGTITFEWENYSDEIVSLEIGKETFTYFVSFNSFETKYFNNQQLTFENISLLSKYISAI